MILCLAILVDLQLLTGRQTDKQTKVAYTTLLYTRYYYYNCFSGLFLLN